MQHYQNFKIASYVRGEFLAQTDLSEIQKGIDFFKQYLGLDKVYLDTHREIYDVPKDKLQKIKKMFQEAGIQISGAITSTVRLSDDHKTRIFDTFCFTDPAYRNKFLEVVRYTASEFDEIILDDFFFTSCRCEDCIKEKGQRTWADFRLKQMADFSEEMVRAAKEVNPKCNFIIKYPNWYESYQECGYNPRVQKDIFDGIYTGTESRHPKYSQQHLQRYLSYSMIRLMENTAPGKNGGGWIDQGDSEANINIWLEQAILTLLAGAKELTLFSFSELTDSQVIPPLGHQLTRIDNLLTQLGTPYGLPVYEPYDADGEDQLMNYLGMTGLPLEPMPCFPDSEPFVLLTASAACDRAIVEKLKTYVAAGNTAVVTSGFLKACEAQGIREMTSLSFTGRKAAGREYWADVFQAGPPAAYEGAKPIRADVLQYKTNATWCDLAFVSEYSNFPLLTRDFYGKGQLLVLTIPDDFSDLYRIPGTVNKLIHQVFSAKLPVYLDMQPRCNLFLYDNDTFGVLSYHNSPSEAGIILNDPTVTGICDLENGQEYYPVPGAKGERQIRISMCNGTYRFFRLLRSKK